MIESLCSSCNKEPPIVGSWACFNKVLAKKNFKKSILEYLSTISEPSDFPVYKKSLDEPTRTKLSGKIPIYLNISF